ncbi:MAG TPA: AAA family ATPase [Methylovirgula sp.]
MVPSIDFNAAHDNNPQAKTSNANEQQLLLTINPADWQGRPIPEKQWLIPGLIPSRVVTLLSGDGGAGKTLPALQIGMAAAQIATLGET